MDEMPQQVAKLLRQAADAHHQAFLAVDGDDPEWPLWYANYLQQPLSAALGRDLSQSEIVYWLMTLDRQARDLDEDQHWTDFYAHALVDELGADTT